VTWRLRSSFGLSLLVAALAGCDYGSGAPPVTPPGTLQPGYDPLPGGGRSLGPAGQPVGSSAPAPPISDQQREKRTAILDAVINLIQTAALKPGGENFKQATQKLNDYFEGTDPKEYAVSPAARAFLLGQEALGRRLTEPDIQGLESPEWALPSARHLEDCMMYYGLATRVAGTGDDLTRVRRLFDWVVRHVELVPAGSLSVPERGLAQAQARPYDVMLRGMATEGPGDWSERGWLFVALCRQLGIDAGLLTYTPRRQKEPVPWVCAILVGDKAYLFDTRIGLAIPGPGGDGVATLDDVLADRKVLDRLDLPGQSPYSTSRADLLASPTKIGVLIDSSPGYLSPRMGLLQRELRGKDRTILFRDPAEQSEAFAKVLGARFGGAKLWQMPITVLTLLFTNPQFAEATQWALSLFRPELPLLHARVQHLRGETSEAIEEYVKFRFAEDLRLANPKKDKVPKEVQEALDAYATYFLALGHLDQGNAEQAEFFFRKTVEMLPEYGPRQPFYTMFRWGAESNLGRLNEAKGDLSRATDYYARPVPTSQHHGDLLRARALIWRNPTMPAAPAAGKSAVRSRQ
jgi:hypothetical protein